MALSLGKHTHINVDAYLDITADTCPMTFVRTKVTLEQMPKDAILHVRLKGGEPLKNVPLSVQEIGHTILLHISHECQEEHSLFIQKNT